MDAAALVASACGEAVAKANGASGGGADSWWDDDESDRADSIARAAAAKTRALMKNWDDAKISAEMARHEQDGTFSQPERPAPTLGQGHHLFNRHRRLGQAQRDAEARHAMDGAEFLRRSGVQPVPKRFSRSTHFQRVSQRLV